ncbi:MAG TPA: SRPBCC family protein [Opitutus sp.]|nr:SRPBCC family protein [Opitutus sp.]
MFLKILIALSVVVLLFVAIVAVQPSQFRTERSLAIAAPPSEVFRRVDHLREFQRWNPWNKVDPKMRTSYSGPDAGVGAAYEWEGNHQIGSGRMTITESRPVERVEMRLDFLKPFPSVCTAEFTFQPQGGSTVVTWSMSGDRSFIPKAFALFIDMDKMIGSQFEAGLRDLKTIVENAQR